MREEASEVQPEPDDDEKAPPVPPDRRPVPPVKEPPGKPGRDKPGRPPIEDPEPDKPRKLRRSASRVLEAAGPPESAWPCLL